MVIGATVAVLQAVVVTGGEWARIGPGAWCALVGAGAAVLGLVLCVRDRVLDRREPVPSSAGALTSGE
ncbi:hypothetical protein [Nocardioides yefusunii]|uniref:hypothetical protein n=1 Tax=Nocardioides yefusunii TaxID=2500546 RepID=UPI000FE2AC86|nr:hypothetical protein [Nocardioides yefusunii]